MFDHAPINDIHDGKKRVVRCPGCKGEGVRTRSTSRTKDGIAPVCGECQGDGVITTYPDD